jgi:hypothetical protein
VSLLGCLRIKGAMANRTAFFESRRATGIY